MTASPTLSIGAGELRAEFWPEAGLLGISLKHRGNELLRRLEDLETAKRKGSTAGIPLLYPWANRLASLHYNAAGREVTLDSNSQLLHFDDKGLPMHGVPWGQLTWKIVDSNENSFRARLDWDRMELLALFPFPHHVEITAKITANSLTLTTCILANADSVVPISFGFHPYFGIPNVPRAQWHLQMPPMRRLQLDPRGIPTGTTENVTAFDGPLADQNFDDGFALESRTANFTLSGGAYKLGVNFLNGFTHAQIFAPKGKDFIALEPMTAPTNAIASGDGLRILQRTERFESSFEISVSCAE
jgi:aldose 1-epimerase